MSNTREEFGVKSQVVRDAVSVGLDLKRVDRRRRDRDRLRLAMATQFATAMCHRGDGPIYGIARAAVGLADAIILDTVG